MTQNQTPKRELICEFDQNGHHYKFFRKVAEEPKQVAEEPLMVYESVMGDNRRITIRAHNKAYFEQQAKKARAEYEQKLKARQEVEA